jgi:hypothetical protein
MTKDITLREARESGKLDKFIEEHDPNLEGDISKALRVVERMAKRPIPTHRTSRKRKRAD